MRSQSGRMWVVMGCLAGLLVNAVPSMHAQDTAGQEERPSTKTDSMIAPDSFRIDAQIIGDRDKKDLLSTDDMVYLNIGQDVAAPGMQGVVYRKVGKVKAKKTRKLLGTEMRKVGTVVITDEVGENVCTARITTSNEPIVVGDLVHLGE